MPMQTDTLDRLRQQAHATYVVAKKDALIYYMKPPVISFGIILPLFFYLAFATGRGLPATVMVPGIVAMALFFTASAIGPLVTPWERQARTYERLVTSPASLEAILAGDMAAGAAFGAALSLVPLLLGWTTTDAAILAPFSLVLGIGLGAAAFSALGVLIAAHATDTPSEVMMLSNLIRLPLIFVSGIFVPLHDMPIWGQRLAPLSPLSYAADLIRIGFGGTGYFDTAIDAGALVGFSILLFALARVLHERARAKA